MPSRPRSSRALRAAALAYLGRNRLLALATSASGRSWSVTVFYAYDNALNLYFYSREDTRHCRNIEKNQSVSAVVNHDWRYPGGEIKGFQVAGRAAKVPKRDLPQALARYRRRFPWAKDFARDHALYRIRPAEVWLIDEKRFGHFFRVRAK